MKFATLFAAIVLVSPLASAKDDDNRPRVPEDIFRRPPIVRPTYSVRVQADPVLPKGERPDATAPSGDGRLSLTIQPERKAFPGNGPVGITVTLTNKSERPFVLYGAEKLGKRPDLVMVHQKTAGQIRMTGDWDADLKGAPILLEPGKSHVRTFAIVMQGGIPVPVPRPQPVPFPLPGPRAAELDAKREVEKIAAPAVFTPAVIAPEGTVRMKLLLEFTAPEGDARPERPAWTGKIASEAVDVEFTAPNWNGIPVVPPIVGPITKEQAITVAQQAAEPALTAAYNPQDPVRPPREGAWITDPQKTATVKERANNAGWNVSWTHTAKGKGHSYHVVVDVDKNGGTNVREVFAGYSNR